MKLNKIHIFLMLLFVLILGCTCLSKSSLFEGYTSSTLTGPAGNSANVATGTNGNAAVVTDTNNTSSTNGATVYTGPQGNKAVVSNDNNNNYNTYNGANAAAVTGPAGNTAVVRKSDIPPGDEDLYVLKTSIVPPVCPACPKYCEREEPCPACPPCARCPEPAFECKKVPNYTSNNDRYLPKPVLSDFSTFGS
jgi:hypothetical protein